MPDTPTGTPADTSADGVVVASRTRPDVLLAAMAEAVLTVPGVVRLEPTLSTAGPGVLLHRSPTDGLRLLDRAGVADVDVNLATTAACQARAVTHHVQDCISGLLHAHGYTPGSVAVSVLTIDPR